MPRVSTKSAARTRAAPRAKAVPRRAASTRSYSYVPRRAVRAFNGGFRHYVKTVATPSAVSGIIDNAVRGAGQIAGNLLSRVTGFGDYKVHKNILLEETNGPPRVINRGNEFVIRKREYIGDVYSASGSNNGVSAFNVQRFPIQPGDPNTFPWLSTIADKFEQYRVEGMIFEFKSLYSDAVVTQNGSIGSIVLATEYNAGDANFSNKQQMENYEFAQSCKPSHSVLHPIECKRSQSVLSELYIRPGAVPAGQDVKTYDFGDFQIASQGIPLGALGAAVNLGELWISYQIVLIKPQIPSGVVPSAQYFHLYTPDSVSGRFVPASPLGTPAAWISDPTTNVSGVAVTSGTVCTLPGQVAASRWLITIIWASNPNVTTGNWRGPTIAVSPGVTLAVTAGAQSLGARYIPFVATAGASGSCSSTFVLDLVGTNGGVSTSALILGGDGSFDPSIPSVAHIYGVRIPM